MNHVEKTLGYTITFVPSERAQPSAFQYYDGTVATWRNWLMTPRVGSKEGTAICAASFVEGAQKKSIDNAASCWAIVMDFDHGDLSPEWAMEKLGVHCIMWTTYNHSAQQPRWRLVIPLAAPIPSSAYTPIWHAVDEILGEYADTSAKDAVRIGYLPRYSKTNRDLYRWKIQEGDLLEPLAYFGWDTLPTAPTWADAVKGKTKGGLVEDFEEPASWPSMGKRLDLAKKYFDKVGHGTEEGGRHAVLFKASCKLWWDFALDWDSVLEVLTEINERFNPPKPDAAVWSEVQFGRDRTVGPHAIPQPSDYGASLQWRPPAPERRVLRDTAFSIAAPWDDTLSVPPWMSEAYDDAEEEEPIALDRKMTMTVDHDEDGTPIEIHASRHVLHGEAPDELIHGAPGLIGWVARYILETSSRPSPTIAVAGALSLVSALAARKWCTSTDARSNLFIVSIAPTGGGKAGPKNAISAILRSVKGCSGYLGAAEIASAAGLVNALAIHPVRVFPLDEFGMMLKSIRGDRASSAQVDIVRKIMEIFTTSSSVYEGAAYASKETKPIQFPSLTIFGPTTNETFIAALSGSDTSSGLLNRMIIFHTEQRAALVQEPKRLARDVPEEIIKAVEKLHLYKPKTSIDASEKIGPMHIHNSLMAMVPDICRMTPEAKAIDAQVIDEIERESIENPRLDHYLARHREMVLKIALCSCIARYATDEGTKDKDGVPMIDEKDMNWAIMAVAFHRGYVEEHLSPNLADNDEQRMNNIVLAEIASYEAGCTLTRLTQALYDKIPRKDHRRRALETLMEADFVEEKSIKIGDSQKRSKIFVITKKGLKQLGISKKAPRT